jgi:hypothetical protein
MLHLVVNVIGVSHSRHLEDGIAYPLDESELPVLLPHMMT